MLTSPLKATVKGLAEIPHILDDASACGASIRFSYLPNAVPDMISSSTGPSSVGIGVEAPLPRGVTLNVLQPRKSPPFFGAVVGVGIVAGSACPFLLASALFCVASEDLEPFRDIAGVCKSAMPFGKTIFHNLAEMSALASSHGPGIPNRNSLCELRMSAERR